MTFLLDLDYEFLKQIINQMGYPSYRLNQIWEGIYQNFRSDFQEFPNLPNSLRKQLSDEFCLSHLKAVKTEKSKDKQTTKVLFELPDGNSIETVLMEYDQRHTLCLSTQSGCALGCVFCATGQMGFFRNLSSGEIIEQVLYFSRVLKLEQKQVSNIVFMGMGEPFHNYDNVLSAIRRMNHPKGLNLGQRRFTISTVGLVPGIRKLTRENSQINLAISLHAATDELRSRLLPINRKYSIPDLLEACEEYVNITNRRISFEWALIDNVNDSIEQANLLGQLLKRFRKDKATLCHVNVIPLNLTDKYEGSPTSRHKVEIFKNILVKIGIPCTIRLHRGIDIKAGCGQLASRNQTKEIM